MANSYLDKTGLTYFWGKVKAYVDANLGAVHITGSGTSGIWSWRKWSDGTAECWGNLTGSVSSWTQWGSLYYSTRIANKAFPTNLFNAVPTVSATIQGASQDVFLCTNGSADATQTSGFYLMRPASSTNATYTLGLYARGSWQ